MKRTPEPNKRNPLPLEDALQMAELNGPGLVETSIPEAWSQGRACFGGLLLAQVARGGEALVSTDRKLRSLNITFVAPTGPGTVRIRYEVIREGRSVSHIQARMTQEDRVVVMSTLAYGTSRPLSLSMESAPMPDAGKPGDGYEMPFNPPATPEFTQHIDYRWVVDHMPFSGSDVAHVRGWVRPTIPSPVDPPLILAMMDAYPPPCGVWPLDCLWRVLCPAITRCWISPTPSPIHTRGFSTMALQPWSEEGILMWWGGSGMKTGLWSQSECSTSQTFPNGSPRPDLLSFYTTEHHTYFRGSKEAIIVAKVVPCTLA